MTQSKRGASRKGGASRASTPKTFTFRGLELKMPAKLPDTLSFDLNDVNLRAAEGDFGTASRMISGILEDTLGREEYVKVRSVVKGLNDPWGRELLETMLEAAGMDPGEA